MASASDDLLDRDTGRSERLSRGVRPGAGCSLRIEPLGRRKKSRVDSRGAEGGADRPQGFANGFQGEAGVLHQGPSVGDLDGVRQGPRGRLAIAAAIARGDLDRRMSRKPSLQSRDLAVRQKRANLPVLQVAHDRPVAMVAAERLIIHPDDAWRLGQLEGGPSHDAQQSVVADREHQAIREVCAGPTAEGETEVVDDALRRAVRRTRAGRKPSPNRSMKISRRH